MSPARNWCELSAPHDGEPHSVTLREDGRLGVALVVQEDGTLVERSHKKAGLDNTGRRGGPFEFFIGFSSGKSNTKSSTDDSKLRPLGCIQASTRLP